MPVVGVVVPLNPPPPPPPPPKGDEVGAPNAGALAVEVEPPNTKAGVGAPAAEPKAGAAAPPKPAEPLPAEAGGVAPKVKPLLA